MPSQPSSAKRKTDQPAVFVPSKKSRNGYEVTTTNDDPMVYPSGSIKFIELKNFMIHSSFKWKPGPKVNIITGVNGAGKSTIMQAFVIGLGERAASTKRNSALKDFIKSGQTKAEVILHISNEGDEPYKPEKYGDTIIFERHIYDSKAATLFIKSTNDETVLSGKEATNEKDSILSHWNIDASNPMVFLQQEEAKKFFTQYSEDNLYDFFEKGSQLAKIPSIEEKIASEIKMYYNSVEKCQKEEKEIEKNIEVLKEKQKYFEGMHSRKKDHFRRAKWSRVAKCERQLENLISQDLAKNQKGHNLTMENLRNKESSLKDIEDEIDKLTSDHAMLQDKIGKANADKETNKSKLEELRQKDEMIDKKIDEAKYKIAANLNEINSQKEAKRKAQQSRRSNGTHSANQDDQLSEQELDEQFKENEQKIKDLKDENEKKGYEREEHDEQLGNFDKELLNCQNDRKQLEKRKKDLNLEEKNLMDNSSEILRYGKAMLEFTNLIKQNASKFSQPPIGPIGTYIKLKSNVGEQNQQLSKLLQVQLGIGLLRGFIVSNRNDQNLLKNLTNEVSRRMSRPFNVTITTWKTIGRRFDITEKRVNKGTGFSVLIDYFDFKHDEVFNVICDKVKAEKIIITTDQMAQTMFASRETVPKNTFLAITETFNRYTPPTHGNYSTFYIDEPRDPITLLVHAKHISMHFKEQHDKIKTQIMEVDAKEREINNRRHEVRATREKINADIKSNIAKLATMNQNKTRLSNMLFEKKRNNRDWDAGIEAYETENKKLKDEKDGYFVQKRDVKADMEKIQMVLNKSQKFFDDKHPELVKMKMELDEKGKLKKTSTNTVRVAKEKFDEYETEKCAIEEKMNAKKAEIEEATEDAKRFGERPPDSELMSRKAEFDAEQKSFDEREKEAVNENGEANNAESLYAELEKQTTTLKELAKKIAHYKAHHDQMNRDYYNRQGKIYKIRNMCCRETKRHFHEMMGDFNMDGQLVISTGRKKFKIMVNPRRGRSEESVPLASLSGGEKSKALSCLIYSLWKFHSSPFRGLDEWDVFLDEKSRKSVEEMLVEGAKTLFSRRSQVFLISPQSSIYNTPEKIKENQDKVKILSLKKTT